jgi:hypothetical protein
MNLTLEEVLKWRTTQWLLTHEILREIEVQRYFEACLDLKTDVPGMMAAIVLECLRPQERESVYSFLLDGTPLTEEIESTGLLDAPGLQEYLLMRAHFHRDAMRTNP